MKKEKKKEEKLIHTIGILNEHGIYMYQKSVPRWDVKHDEKCFLRMIAVWKDGHIVERKYLCTFATIQYASECTGVDADHIKKCIMGWENPKMGFDWVISEDS